MAKSWHDERLKFSKVSYEEIESKIKAGALLRINCALDFLWRGSKQKDYFDLYVPLLEEAIALVLKPCILCGDSRFGCRDMYLSNLNEFPEFYKNLESYDIVSTLTPCVEVLHEDKILYLECELFLTALHKKWIEVLQ